VSTRPCVFITGAGGHAAPAIATRLDEGGFAIRALVRTQQAARAVKQRGWEPIVGDLTQFNTLVEAIDGVDLVVHAAAYSGDDWGQARTVNEDGARLLASAALEAKVRRFVHISTMSVHGEPMPNGMREDSPLVTGDTSDAYVATKARAELEILGAQDRGLETVILRPGAICAAVNSQWGDELITRMSTEGWAADWHPDDVLPWVHTENLAEMTWLASTHPAAANETFFAVDRNAGFREWLVPLANALGCAIVPPTRPPEISRCHLGKIVEMLGYAPRRDFEDTMRELLELAAALVWVRSTSEKAE
jgi:nucleoside-diphosphate-sugar epimerase